MLRLNVTKSEKKKCWKTTYSSCRCRIARKDPFSIFCKLQPIMELQKLFEKDSVVEKFDDDYY